MSARKRAARSSRDWNGSSADGHHTSSTAEKSSSGQVRSSPLRGVPTSQVKAQRSRTSGLTTMGTPSAAASGAAVCNALVYGETMMRRMRSPASAASACPAWAWPSGVSLGSAIPGSVRVALKCRLNVVWPCRSRIMGFG